MDTTCTATSRSSGTNLWRRLPLIGRMSSRSAAVTIAGTIAGTASSFAVLVVAGELTSAVTGAAIVAVSVLVTEAMLQGRQVRSTAPDDPTVHTPEAILDAPAGLPRESLGPTDKKLNAIRDYIEKIPDFCDILKEHAKSVIRETEDVSYAFINDLNEIDGKIKDLKAFVVSSGNDITDFDERSKNTKAQNLKLMDEIGTSFDQNSTTVQCAIDERTAFSQVVGTMRRLHVEVGVIDDIARKIKLLSLNASIEAARAAEYGAGFAVIAKEIRELSDQTHKATHTLGPLIEKACGSVEEFAADQGVETRLRSQLDLFNTMREHLGSVTQTYTQMLDHERALTTHTEAHSVGIEDAICRTLAALQFQDIVRQQLEGVIAALDDLHGTIRHTVAVIENPDDPSGPDPSTIACLIDRLHDRYVMARQRAAHARIDGRQPNLAAGGSGAAIELF